MTQDIAHNYLTRGQVIYRGLPVLPQGVEWHRISAGDSLLVRIHPRDELVFINDDGGQCAEIFAFDAKGNSAPQLIGADGGEVRLSQDIIKAHLKTHAINKRDLKAVSLFDEKAKPGNRITFEASAEGSLLVCSHPHPTSPWQAYRGGFLSLYIKRDNPEAKDLQLTAPSPLAEPLSDTNILPGTAHAYVVKAGEYIQILDVKGRECSDFQAFCLRGVDEKQILEIDPTTTRSLMGSIYPQPGLFRKYYNHQLRPLVEIVQDTCGRHDSFNLACTARYYEDLGYFGHPNCSDNISRAVGDYGLAARKGWSAINFFFNTFADAGNAICMDEPWSRPGDYVLLRAVTDILCVSTACPCDVDSANGWQPTDIQVRTYRAGEDFKPSIAFRKTPEAPMQTTQNTPFHECFARFTKDFTEYSGFWLANKMDNSGAIGEYWACRDKAIITDLSPLRKYDITGPDALALCQLCLPRDVKKLAVGQVVYSAMCYEHGGMIDDGTLFRLNDENFRWVGGSDDSGLWLKQQAEKHKMDVFVRDASANLCNVAVQGRLSRDILKQVFWVPEASTAIEDLGWFRFSIARLGDFEGAPCMISRTGYSGELGYEVFCHPDDAVRVFEAIWKVGEPLGLQPLGLLALDMLRIEAGLIFAGYEFCDQTDPFEAGIGFSVPITKKTDDFIGKQALQKRHENPQRKLVGLNIEGNTVPGNGDGVFVGKAQVGAITSAMQSPILGKVIALARVDATHADIGGKPEVGLLDGEQKRLSAEIISLPHFDPDKKRVRGDYSS